MDTQAIKAELYDLQGHTCDGRLTVPGDGKWDETNRSCSGCNRIMELQAMLREKVKAATPTNTE